MQEFVIDGIPIVKYRVLEFVKKKKLSKYAFAKSIFSSQALFTPSNDKYDLNGRNIVAIATTYPDLSAEWLLRGSGEMLLTGAKLSDSLNAISSVPICETIEEASRKENIELLKNTIELLRERVKDLEEEVAHLNKELSNYH